MVMRLDLSGTRLGGVNSDTQQQTGDVSLNFTTWPHRYNQGNLLCYAIEDAHPCLDIRAKFYWGFISIVQLSSNCDDHSSQ